MEGCSVIVIGGGPSGVLTAAHMAKLGARVTVYERRTAAEQDSPQRGWTIGISGVGMKAIADAGLSTDFGPSAKSEGSSVQTGMNPAKYFGAWAGLGVDASRDAQCTRAHIIKHLREQCRKVYPDLITFANGFSIVGGNLVEGEVILEPVEVQSTVSNGAVPTNGKAEAVENGGKGENGKTECAASLRYFGAGDDLFTTAGKDKQITVKADLVVAADGAGSHTRNILQQLDPKLKVNRVRNYTSSLPFYMPPQGDPLDYCKMETPSGKPWFGVPEHHKDPITGGWACFQYPAPEADGGEPGMEHFFFSCREGGKDLCGLLTCKSEWWYEKRSEEQLLEMLKRTYPQMPTAWLKMAAESCCEVSDNPYEKGLRTASFVNCSHLGTGRCILVGDAAHAVSPNLGYGCTSGMSDAAILPMCVENVLASPERKGVLAKTASEKLAGMGRAWTKERLADARAYVRFSRAFADAFYMKYHRNYLAIAMELPVLVPGMMSFHPSFPGAGVFKPPKFISELVSVGGRPADLERQMLTTFWSWVGLVGLCTAAGVGLTMTAVARLR